METLDFRRSSTLAKTLGTLVSISGALIAILYKGPVILSSQSPQSTFSVEYPLRTLQKNWVLGGLLLVAFCILNSVWYILQVIHFKNIPPTHATKNFFFGNFINKESVSISPYNNAFTCIMRLYNFIKSIGFFPSRNGITFPFYTFQPF